MVFYSRGRFDWVYQSLLLCPRPRREQVQGMESCLRVRIVTTPATASQLLTTISLPLMRSTSRPSP